MRKVKCLDLILAFSGLFLSFIIVRFIGVHTSIPDSFFTHIQSFISRTLYSISSFISFSLGDLFYLVLGGLGFFITLKLLEAIWKKNYKLFRKKIVQILWFLTFFYWVFQIFWGFNYYKNPLNKEFTAEEISLDELKSMAEFYFNRSVYYREKVNEDEFGVFKINLTQNEINTEIIKSAQKIKTKYPEIRLTDSTPPNLKSSLFSVPFSYLGIGGYYIPFTAESQYINTLPDTKILFTQLHETAHQWGFAPENEANFVGFLLGYESSNPDLNYASNYRAMRSILNRILLYDPVYVQIMFIRYSDGMKRDRKHERFINEKYTGSGEEAFSAMNEAFLRMNNQEGLESYGHFVELLIGFNRKYASE